MIDVEKIISDIREINKNFISQSQVNIKQLHYIKNAPNYMDVFALVIGENANNYTVIPGSFDYTYAGPSDIVLPKNILGKYFTLSLDLVHNLPKFRLGDSFAVLDDKTFERVELSLDEYKKGEQKNSYPFALPYLHDDDYRKPYKEEFSQLIKNPLSILLDNLIKFNDNWDSASDKLMAASSDNELSPLYALNNGNSEFLEHARCYFFNKSMNLLDSSWEFDQIPDYIKDKTSVLFRYLPTKEIIGLGELYLEDKEIILKEERVEALGISPNLLSKNDIEILLLNMVIEN